MPRAAALLLLLALAACGQPDRQPAGPPPAPPAVRVAATTESGCLAPGYYLAYRLLHVDRATRVTEARVVGEGVELVGAWTARRPAGPARHEGGLLWRGDLTGVEQRLLGWAERRPAEGSSLAAGEHYGLVLLRADNGSRLDEVRLSWADGRVHLGSSYSFRNGCLPAPASTGLSTRQGAFVACTAWPGRYVVQVPLRAHAAVRLTGARAEGEGVTLVGAWVAPTPPGTADLVTVLPWADFTQAHRAVYAWPRRDGVAGTGLGAGRLHLFTVLELAEGAEVSALRLDWDGGAIALPVSTRTDGC